MYFVETLCSCKNASFGQQCSVLQKCAWNIWTLQGPWTTWSNPRASVWRARRLPGTPSGLKWWRWSVMKKRLCSVWACSVYPFHSSTTWTPRVPSARTGTIFFFSYLISIIVGCCKEIKWPYLKRKKFTSFNESRVVITDHCGAS